MGLDRTGSPPGRAVVAEVTGRWRRGPAGLYRHAARRRSSSRWRAIAGSRYECIDMGPSPGDLWGFRQPAVSARRGEGDRLAVLPPARSPARASALARTTSGSRGSGGRSSCQGRSRRALGRWIRIRCTVSHLPGRPPIPWGPVAGSPALVARLFGKRYGFPPAQGVTRRCLPGGISQRGDRSPEGATRSAGVRCQGTGRAAGPAWRPRCGWRPRACPGCGSHAFDRVERR